MKQAIVFGAGNIGRGFIGQTFSLSGYHVTFVDIFPDLVEALNSAGSYPVQIVSDQVSETCQVGPVSALLSTQTDAVVDAVAGADLMATAVGVKALTAIAPLLAAGFRRRWLQGNQQPLDILVCENKLDADVYLRELVREHLAEHEHASLDRLIGFVEASIGRMVPQMPEQLRRSQPLLIQVEPYHELPVDAAGFRGPIPDLIALKPFAPFDFYIQRKLFVHNLGHAVTAYLGWLKKYETIADAVQDESIRSLARQAMMESAEALASAYPVSMDDLAAHVDDLLARFANRSLGDTVFRVGRDPLRKLGHDDRLAGALLFALDQKIEPMTIAVGLAAGLLFDAPDDPSAQAMQDMLRQNGLDAFLASHAGLTGMACHDGLTGMACHAGLAGSGDRDAWRAHVVTLYRVLTLRDSNRRDDHDQP